MRSLLFILIFVPVLAFSSTDDPNSFSFSDNDKQLHMLASYGLTYTFTDIYRRGGSSKWKSLMWGSLSTLAIGTLKELTDAQFSKADMVADSIGIVVGAGVIISLDAIYEPRAHPK